jgi:ABC-type glutathione transport system ATPase component
MRRLAARRACEDILATAGLIAMNDTSPAGNLSALTEHAPSAISARGLVKTFGKVRAVDGIDLDVPRGMIFAILGPNCAGKTTLMRMLATLPAPTPAPLPSWGTISCRPHMRSVPPSP